MSVDILSSLPAEIALNILTHCDLRTLITLAQVSHSWNRWISPCPHRRFLWSNCSLCAVLLCTFSSKSFRRRFPLETPFWGTSWIKYENITWKERVKLLFYQSSYVPSALIFFEFCPSPRGSHSTSLFSHPHPRSMLIPLHFSRLNKWTQRSVAKELHQGIRYQDRGLGRWGNRKISNDHQVRRWYVCKS